MGKVTYIKQPDGTIVKIKPLDDPVDTLDMLKTKRLTLQGQYDFFQQLTVEALPAVQQQLQDLDDQIAALTPLADTKPVDPIDPNPIDVQPANLVELGSK